MQERTSMQESDSVKDRLSRQRKENCYAGGRAMGHFGRISPESPVN